MLTGLLWLPPLIARPADRDGCLRQARAFPPVASTFMPRAAVKLRSDLLAC